VTLSWPLHNLGTSLPNLLATIAGNLWELKPFSGMRLLDVRLPPAFLQAYRGPQFGVAGTRSLTGVHGRPLIGTIIKPSIGLSPEATAAQVKVLVEAGIDFIKDDELQADGPHCPFDARLRAVMHVINAHADRTGKKVMYAANITGEIDEMRRRHDLVVAERGTCVMVSMNSIGLPALKVLREHAQVAIHGHRNGWGLLGRSPAIGMSFVAYQKFWRLAGIDHTHVNGLRNKFCEDDASVLASARECLTPMFDVPGRGCEVMPVFSSGQTASQAPDTYRGLGSLDLIHAAGGGIMGHPNGVAAGVRSLREAWEAAVAGVPLEDYGRSHPDLKASLERFSTA
jgi:ribulose-bisphosphate carboxylase large chain